MCVSGDAAGSCVWMVHQLGAKKVAVGNHLRGREITEEKGRRTKTCIYMNASYSTSVVCSPTHQSATVTNAVLSEDEKTESERYATNGWIVSGTIENPNSSSVGLVLGGPPPVRQVRPDQTRPDQKCQGPGDFRIRRYQSYSL
jgi:hypothetical protein